MLETVKKQVFGACIINNIWKYPKLNGFKDSTLYDGFQGILNELYRFPYGVGPLG